MGNHRHGALCSHGFRFISVIEETKFPKFLRRVALVLLFVPLLFLPLLAAAASPALVSESRVWLGSQHTRLVFDMNQRVSHSLFALSRPERLILELRNARLASPLRSHDFAGSLVTGMEGATQGGNSLRIVLDLAQPVVPRAKVIRQGGGYRLVLDLYDRRPSRMANPTVRPRATLAVSAQPVRARAKPTHAALGEQARPLRSSRAGQDPIPVATRREPLKDTLAGLGRPNSVPAAQLPPFTPSSPYQSALADKATKSPVRDPGRELYASGARVPRGTPVKGARDIVVVIDAGHGGEDPGAIGPSGVREKDVTLAIARKLAALVGREPQMRAVLTRRGDVFLPLRERMRIAREHKADLFISIHADAFTDREARGSSVFVLSEHGASSEAARWLAEQENAADLIGGVSLGDKEDMVAAVLLDLSQTAAIEESMDVASQVLGALRNVGSMHKHEVQFAGFAVLKSPDVPSVLVETAFITNPLEERKLSRPSYQDEIARALIQGIRTYFAKRLPSRTVLAEREPVVSAGEDTLSDISRR
jgi:N-acetylmuramoyl-L-alanine amidase